MSEIQWIAGLKFFTDQWYDFLLQLNLTSLFTVYFKNWTLHICFHSSTLFHSDERLNNWSYVIFRCPLPRSDVSTASWQKLNDSKNSVSHDEVSTNIFINHCMEIAWSGDRKSFVNRKWSFPIGSAGEANEFLALYRVDEVLEVGVGRRGSERSPPHRTPRLLMWLSELEWIPPSSVVLHWILDSGR